MGPHPSLVLEDARVGKTVRRGLSKEYDGTAVRLAYERDLRIIPLDKQTYRMEITEQGVERLERFRKPYP